MHLPTYTVALFALLPAVMGAAVTPRNPQLEGKIGRVGFPCQNDNECIHKYCGADKKCRLSEGESCSAEKPCHGFGYYCAPDDVCRNQGRTPEGHKCKYSEECAWGRCDKGVCDKGKGQFGSTCQADEECTGKNPYGKDKMVCAKSPFIGRGEKVCREPCTSKLDCEGKIYPDKQCVATGLPCLKTADCCRGSCSWMNELPIPACRD